MSANTPMSMCRRRRGFTLLELMIVLLILVAVMSVAWPRITRQLALVGPREAAVQLKGDLESAREQAVVSGEPWALRIERGKRNYEIGPVAEFRKRDQMQFSIPTGGDTSVDQLIGLTADDRLTVTEPENTTVETLTPIESLELPAGMVFDDGVAHATQDVNAVRAPQSGVNPVPNTLPNPGLNPNSAPAPCSDESTFSSGSTAGRSRCNRQRRAGDRRTEHGQLEVRRDLPARWTVHRVRSSVAGGTVA